MEGKIFEEFGTGGVKLCVIGDSKGFTLVCSDIDGKVKKYRLDEKCNIKLIEPVNPKKGG